MTNEYIAVPSFTLHVGEVIDPTNTNRDLYANKGYVDGMREMRLKRQGSRTHIQRKGSKDKPISEAQERRNKRIAKTRVRVEHIFASLAHMGTKVLRSVGLPRATLHLNWKVSTYNLQRLCHLMKPIRMQSRMEH
ncbi:transposase [Janthinobacterium lividum]|uniref:transposase n=1 Tax=Janthinobacterium sp. LB2P10 TaxID=3424194 RepID=UPI001300C10B